MLFIYIYGPHMQPTPNILTPQFDTACTHVATQLSQQGWSAFPDFLDAQSVTLLRQQALQEWQAGRFRHAGVGRGESFEIKPDIRNDQVMWLEQAQCDNGFTAYFNALEVLRTTINQQLYLGLFDFEAHLAVYPPGSFYKKHLDQFRGIGRRTVTTTFYLNENWLPEQGGQLRLYTDKNAPNIYHDILPQAGTLVAFLSADFLHEVLPATRERLSITGWFRRREP
jgi:SM-20-related protein